MCMSEFQEMEALDFAVVPGGAQQSSTSYFPDRDDTERTFWDPEGTKNSAVSEQREPFRNSGLT